MSSGSRRQTLGLLALLALSLGLGREAVFEGRVYFLRDLHLQWFGQVETFVSTIAAGDWPVWDPYVGFGQPMLANANAQVLYPLTWLNLIMRPGTYYALYFIVHIFLAASGTAALARRLGVSPSGALLAGAFWTASGPFLSLGNLWNHLAAAAWMPWALLGAEHAVAGSRRGAVGGAFAIAAMVFAGSPDFVIFTVVLLVARLLGRPDRHRVGSAKWWRSAVLVLGMFLLGGGLSGPQLLPSLELARASTRWAMGAESRAYWSAHPGSLLQVVLPMTWNAVPWNRDVRALLFESREPYLLSLFLGLPLLAFAMCGLFDRSARDRFWLGGSAALLTLFALGKYSPLYAATVALLPPLGMLRFPSKALVPAALCVGLLAGFGYDLWRERGLPRAVGFGLAVPTLGALALLVACQIWPAAIAAALLMTDPGGARAALGPAVGASSVLAVTGLLLLTAGVLAARRRRVARASAPGLALGAIFQLVGFNGHVNPTAPADFFAWRSEALNEVRSKPEGRLFVFDYDATPGAARAYLGRDAALLFPAVKSPRELWRGAVAARAYPIPPVPAAYGLLGSFERDLLGIQQRPLARLNATMLKGPAPAMSLRLLRIGAVRHVLALHHVAIPELSPVGRWPGLFVEDVQLFRVPETSPRAFVVGRSRVGDIDTLLDPTFDPRAEVVLSELGREQPVAVEGWKGRARLIDPGFDHLRIDVEASAPGWLVVVDAYDPGWTARVDGRPASLLRANVAFRAVAVPAGRHVVTMAYRPGSLWLGLVIAIAAIVGLLVLGWSPRQAEPRPGD